MTQYLPPNLLALFASRDPIPFMPPVDKLPHEKKSRGYLGVANFMSDFEDPEDTPLPKTVETRQERLERRRREKAEQVAYKLEREIALWDPTEIKNATEDPFRTLFIARINYDTSESKLRREFEFYGPIKKIVLIHDQESGEYVFITLYIFMPFQMVYFFWTKVCNALKQVSYLMERIFRIISNRRDTNQRSY